MSQFFKIYRWKILVWLILLGITAVAWGVAHETISRAKTQLSTGEKPALLTSQDSPSPAPDDPSTTPPVRNNFDSRPVFSANKTTPPTTTSNREPESDNVYGSAHTNETLIPTNLTTTTLIVSGTSYETHIENNSTVLELMTKIATESEMTFGGKIEGDLGYFVEEINGKANNPRAGTYWVYYINNKRAPLGVSSQHIFDNDTIEWKYEKIF